MGRVAVIVLIDLGLLLLTGFRDNMAEAAAALNDPMITADWLAERILGRERDGDVLIPSAAQPVVAGQPDNDFGFLAKDRRGPSRPVGSHIRRANPQDSLARQGGFASRLVTQYG